MAAPEGISLANMTGRWVVNKTLSDDFDAVLALQGVPWWKRQAAGIITVTEHITHTQDTNKIHHMLIEQKMTGGFNGGSEAIIVDGSEQSFRHEIFGEISEQAWWTDLSDVDEEWLKEDWSSVEGKEKKVAEGKEHLKVTVTNKALGWELSVVWGFMVVEGERYHSRRMICRKGEQVERAKSVYSWAGENDQW